MQEKGNYFGDKGLDGERGRVECRSREWVLRAGGRTHCEGRECVRMRVVARAGAGKERVSPCHSV